MPGAEYFLVAWLCWPANALPGAEPGCQFIRSEPVPIAECHELKARVIALRSDGEPVAWAAMCALTSPSTIVRKR